MNYNNQLKIKIGKTIDTTLWSNTPTVEMYINRKETYRSQYLRTNSQDEEKSNLKDKKDEPKTIKKYVKPTLEKQLS